MYQLDCLGTIRALYCTAGAALALTGASVAQATGDQPASATPQPTSTEVLKAIYRKDSHGASNFDVGQGRYATYWYHYAFSLGGISYFTGLAYNTAPTAADSNDMPGSETKVTITEATFQQSAAGTSPSWSLLGVQHDLGQFGGNAKGNEVDTTQPPPNYRTTTGKLVLAIPGWYLASGSRIFSYEIFAFDSHITGTKAIRWSYLGNVNAGEDNSAACGAADGSNIPCLKSHGALSFMPGQNGDMPAIHIVWNDTGTDKTGHIRKFGPSDIDDYRYDSASNTYMQAKP